MSSLPRPAKTGEPPGPIVARACRTGGMALCCLTAASAAYAHADDAPATAETTWIGIGLFMLVTFMVVFMSVRARLPVRRRPFWSQFRRRLRRKRP